MTHDTTPHRYYRAFMYAAKGHFLLGGVKYHQSTAFDTRTEAEQWLSVCSQANHETGHQISETGIEELITTRREARLTPSITHTKEK